LFLQVKLAFPITHEIGCWRRVQTIRDSSFPVIEREDAQTSNGVCACAWSLLVGRCPGGFVPGRTQSQHQQTSKRSGSWSTLIGATFRTTICRAIWGYGTRIFLGWPSVSATTRSQGSHNGVDYLANSKGLVFSPVNSNLPRFKLPEMSRSRVNLDNVSVAGQGWAMERRALSASHIRGLGSGRIGKSSVECLHRSQRLRASNRTRLAPKQHCHALRPRLSARHSWVSFLCLIAIRSLFKSWIPRGRAIISKTHTSWNRALNNRNGNLLRRAQMRRDNVPLHVPVQHAENVRGKSYTAKPDLTEGDGNQDKQKRGSRVAAHCAFSRSSRFRC